MEAATVTFTSQPQHGYVVSSRFSTYVDPGEAIPVEASRIHGVYDHDVVAAPTTRQALPRILSSLRHLVLVGYNILEYDLPVLRAECRRHDLGDDFDVTMSSLKGLVDVMPWAARTTREPMYRRGARTLATMSARHGVEMGRAHSAVDDAQATGELMLALMSSGAMPCLGDVVEATWGTWSSLRR